MRRHRDRAAKRFHAYNALFVEADELLLERIGDIRRPFPTVLNIGAHKGPLMDGLARRPDADKGFVVASNLSPAMLSSGQPSVTNRIIADEEFLPFAPQTFDLIVSSLNLHWVNDLPGALVQIKSALKPGGAFLANLIGGASLMELRQCLTEAEMIVSGGMSPRLSPTIDLLTMSALMQRAGFEVPVVDEEKVTMLYPDMTSLMHDLRGMGESNATLQRLRRPTSRKVFALAEHIYREKFGDADGHLPASFDLLFIHGWKA